MLFNSFSFALFLPTVFAAYWLIGSRRRQNLFLMIASYVFYGWWDWRFLGLILLSSCVDYVAAHAIHASSIQTVRKRWFSLSLSVNLGLLGFFKYFNFFAASLHSSMASVGVELSGPTLSIVLPVGISFYTFQTLSYTIDVYRRRIEPVREPIAFFAFVAFFPQLVAGPIERASNLLPQFQRSRSFDPVAARDGMRQILWGLFKKVVVADSAGVLADQVFAQSHLMSGSTLLLGAFYFSIQIYGDFSGYSDIAIGTARLLGFDLMRNFAFPYFSRDIAEFWRRWHISLSTWFRDYVYIPMGGSRASTARSVWNIMGGVSGQWPLARSELDLCRLGGPERVLFRTPFLERVQPHSQRGHGRCRSTSPEYSRGCADGHDLLFDHAGLGVLPRRERDTRVAVPSWHPFRNTHRSRHY